MGIASIFSDIKAKSKYLIRHRTLEMARCTSLCFKIVPPRDERVSVSDVGRMLVALQDMAWQMGYYLEKVPYRESGSHRKEILQKYDLLFKDVRSGSVEIDVIPSEWTQSTIDHGDVSLPGHRAVARMTEFLYKAEQSDRESLKNLVEDSSYRARMLRDVAEMIPSEEDHVLHVLGEGRRRFSLKPVHKARIIELQEPEEHLKGVEARIGVLDKLTVDGELAINMTRCKEGFKAVYPPELEPDMRNLLGHPARVFGDVIRGSAKGQIKEFSIQRVQPLELLEIEPFEIEGRTFRPMTKVNAQVDYVVGEWRVAVPGINAVGYGELFEEAVEVLRDHLLFLWEEYVDCDEEMLGVTGVLLRKVLLKTFRVE